VVGKNVSLLAPADRPNEIPSILEKIKRGETVMPFESVRVRKDGRHLNVSVSVSPLRDANGKVVGASAIVRDTTAQTLAGDHLRHAQKMEAIGRLAGGVAHDVNNVLAIVMACAELLRGADLNAESAEYVANIKDAVSRGSAMTRQLLAFSRKSVIHKQVLDLNQRLMEVVRLLHPLMGDEVEIVITARSPSALVEADATQLDQMVLNLAINSHDAMLHGGKFMMETANVQVDETFNKLHQAIIPGKYVLLVVSDTGVGMDAATVAHIFEPFFTTKEVGKGGGLGLATVHGIVQQIGGHIRVYSEPGHGTTFKIYLPYAENKIGVETKTQEDAEVPKRPGTTILLVEDDPVILHLTRRLLAQHEYKVLEAEDGQAALDVAKSYLGRIDLVITDVVMKRMSGTELAGRLRISHPELKVIYMSGYTGQRVAAQELSKDVATLVEKPFTRATLLRTVHEALG
jgi:two-component system cell cycle sensor histidine kinase/response regulator CckA